MDRPLTTVSGWIRHERWRWPKRAPWSAKIVPEVLRWSADELLRGRPEKPEATTDKGKLRDEKLRAEVRKILAQAEAAETALARERGKLYDAADVDREWATLAVLVRNGFQNLGSQLVPLALSHGMPHEAAPAFQQQIEEAVNGILRHLSRDSSERADDSTEADQ